MIHDGTFKRFLHRLILNAEQDVDRIQQFLAGDTSHEPLRMLAYAGYRNADELRVSGRIVRYATPLKGNGGLISNMRAMAAIYNSHEVSGVAVCCDAYGTLFHAQSDAEGYFQFTIPLSRALPPSTRWEAVALSTPGRTMQAPSVEVPILAPGLDDHWAVISDIDDTVIETGATSFIRNWRRVLAQRPADRIAVPGAASLYGMIARDHAAPTRPFFYVSSSPWNLHGFLVEFMDLNQIPHGPMFLKDLGIDPAKFGSTGHDEHKLEAIRTVLAFYPTHKFLLIGDNGQRDVEIYAEAVRSFPGRIGAVFIRDVGGTCTDGAKAGLLQAMRDAGVVTYCAAGFTEAVGLLTSLGLERPVEVTRAAGQAPENR